jgi:methionyl-tRNA synthetase
LGQQRDILVTSALPYANAPLHIGHIVEYTQTDIFARFQRMRGNRCIYVCASDAHGTPTMLRAEAAGVAPEELVAEVAAGHQAVFDRFRISVDNYLTTHSSENQELTASIYERLVEAGHIHRKTIKQAYDQEKEMFLPDRYVRGTCPVCHTPDQYGDSCENCSATYTPMDLEDPVSVVSGTTPSVRESEHLFFRLENFEEELREWVPRHVDAALARKLDEWFEAGLRDWDISRDSPYFGFEIPGEPGKYFYVWFDAPIGYMASFLNLCRRSDLDFDEFWGADSNAEIYHFIGKDIVYFHTLFWPSVLSGAGYRKPSGVVVHGFLTVDGQKMSKSRGTFINASTYADHLEPDCLRYYFAAKLGIGADDLDLSMDDFTARVNSDLVGKLINIGSRCAGFIHRQNAGLLTAELPRPELFEEFAAASEDIASDSEKRNYARAVRRIMALADKANQYIDEEKPWLKTKNPDEADAVPGIATLGLNLFRTLIVYLRPVIPEIAERAEAFLDIEPLMWADAQKPLLGHRIERFQTILERVDPKEIEAMIAESSEASDTDIQQDKPSEQQIDFDYFSKIELRVAKVVEASHVDGADKLLKLRLDLGDETREIFSGIRAAYNPEDLEGRLVITVDNLKPRKMRFGVSEGMVLASGPGGEDIFLLSVDSGATPGMKVT